MKIERTFLKVEVDWPDKCLCDHSCGFPSERHRFGDSGNAKLDHDRVSVTVDDLGVKLVAIAHLKVLLNKLKRNGIRKGK